MQCYLEDSYVALGFLGSGGFSRLKEKDPGEILLRSRARAEI